MKKPVRDGLEMGQRKSEGYLPFDLLALSFGVSADAATDLTAADVRWLLSSLAAVDATRAEVCSFVGFFVAIYYLIKFTVIEIAGTNFG